ncbi:MAG: hypothetical protein DRR06_04645 [Gammaproteobacteria bacterium]|nr:MAG: hypothetical protein DRR06_04645 [Gammaproteobacteria bacterium]RLA51853.1 MAG: hypothetical protein DRR42_09195 [Gammaproteobacteria bacterium]
MTTIKQNKTGQLTLAILLIIAGTVAYVSYRQQVFEVLASGTQWVLITCGFVPEGGEDIQSDRLRKLYYAARMFNETPPKVLMTEDRLAAERYPGMGFGMIHTFDTRPVSTIIGGWLFAIPCTYFTDGRNCNKPRTTARLKVSAVDFRPISYETIEQFLSAASPDVIRITIAGLEGWPQNWWQQKTINDNYHRYSPPEERHKDNEFVCTDTQWAEAEGVMDHCLLRFMHGDDVIVELKFAAVQRDRWADIRNQAKLLVNSFQVKQ